MGLGVGLGEGVGEGLGAGLEEADWLFSFAFCQASLLPYLFFIATLSFWLSSPHFLLKYAITYYNSKLSLL